MATRAPGKKKSKLLVYEPRALAGIVRKTAKSKAGTVLEVHNYRGAVAHVTRAKTLELTLPGDAEAHAGTPEEVIERLEVFVRKG